MIKTPLSTVIGGAFWTPNAMIVGSANQNLSSLIKSIFANNEEGFAYDPNDLTTMFQDSAGTIPVTGGGQPVGLMLDKSKGLALGQNIATATNVIGTGIGGSTYKTSPIATNAKVGTRYKVSYRVSNYNGTGSVGIESASFGIPVFMAVGMSTNGIMTFIAEAQSSSLKVFTRDTNNADFLDISIQEIKGNHAYQTVSASRPILQLNATTGAYYLAFDGVDDFLQTNNIDFTATDKVSLFAGVRKLSDAATGIVAELSTRAGTGTNLGAFALYAPYDGAQKGYGFRSIGTLESTTFGTLPLSPTSNVLAAKSSIAQDILTLRVNSTQYGALTQDQGTGNYGNYPLYIGRRGGTSQPFTGHLYSLIGIGRLTTDSETIALEKSIAKNTGVTLNV